MIVLRDSFTQLALVKWLLQPGGMRTPIRFRAVVPCSYVMLLFLHLFSGCTFGFDTDQPAAGPCSEQLDNGMDGSFELERTYTWDSPLRARVHEVDRTNDGDPRETTYDVRFQYETDDDVYKISAEWFVDGALVTVYRTVVVLRNQQKTVDAQAFSVNEDGDQVLTEVRHIVSTDGRGTEEVFVVDVNGDQVLEGTYDHQYTIGDVSGNLLKDEWAGNELTFTYDCW